MNKFGVVLGIAAVATLAGCKDPDFKRAGSSAAQNDVKNAETVSAESAASTCKCPPGTKHDSPCTCGAPDCKCVVETKPVAVVDVSAKPVEPEYTIYIVQNGDYLAKISKKFNVTISSIKRLNPSIKKDVVRVGQKLKLPGKIDVGVQETPKASTAVKAASVCTTGPKAAKKSYTPYTGATKEYVVQNGDTLGSIAYGNGINIRQLKDLNALSSDSLKIGQKLKVPAEKVVTAKKPTPAKEEVKPAVAEVKPAAPAEAAKAPDAAAPAPAAEATAPVAAEAAPAAEAAKTADAAPEKAASAASSTYVVQEGDDMTGVSIRWGVSAAEIRELNNLADGDQLVPGQIIKLPPGVQQ